MREDQDRTEQDAWAGDPLGDALRGLAVHDLDAARAARIRQRCGSVLARRARRTPSTEHFSAWWRSVEPAAALGACGVYLAATAQAALALARAVW